MLNKNGKISKRNLAKPWRPISKTMKNGVEVEKPLETMVFHKSTMDGIVSYRMITNGTFGSMTQNGRGNVPYVLKVGTKSTPGKCFGRKKKKSGGLSHKVSKYEDEKIELIKLKRKINRWDELFNAVVLGFVKSKSGNKRPMTEEEHWEFASLRKWLETMLPKSEWESLNKRAQARRKSLLGMMAKGQV